MALVSHPQNLGRLVVLAGLVQLVQVLVRDGAYACASFSCACHELVLVRVLTLVLLLVIPQLVEELVVE